MRHSVSEWVVMVYKTYSNGRRTKPVTVDGGVQSRVMCTSGARVLGDEVVLLDTTMN